MAGKGFPGKGTPVRRKGDGLTGEVYAVRSGKGLLAVRFLEESKYKTLVVNSEQFANDWGVTGKSRSVRNIIKSAIIIPVIFGICFYAWLRACGGGPTEFTYPETVLDHHLSPVNGNSELEITLKLREKSDNGFFLSLAPDDIRKIMKHEQQQPSGEDILVFHIVGDIGGGYNDYGNPIPANLVSLFDITYTKFDLMQINWEHQTSPGGLLNIGAVSNISRYGASVGQSYCQEAREWSEVFCENF